MGSLLGPDRLRNLERVSDSIVRLPASASDPVIARIGGRQFVVQAPISCNISTNGLNGLDIGSPSAHTLLYFYLVRQAGVIGIVASLSDIAPAGYTALNMVFLGAFNVNFQTVIGGLILDYQRELQPISFRVDTDDPANNYNSGSFTNATYIAEFDDIREDSHLRYDITNGRWYSPYTKPYTGNASASASGTYSNNGTISTSIRRNNAETIANNIIRNAASTSSFSVPCVFSDLTIPIGQYLDMRVAFGNWSSVSPNGASDQNQWGARG